jgi:phenylalanyl-tRNA synthetase beta chain
LLREITGREAETVAAMVFGFHPGKSAQLSVEGRRIGSFGCVDPRLSKAFGIERNAYICLLDVAALPEYATPRYRAPSKFPSTYRDVALVIGLGTSAREIERSVAETLGPLCTRVAVFDEYRGPQIGEDRKSLAVRMTLQRSDTTITDDEADAAVSQVLEALRDRFGAQLRT